MSLTRNGRLWGKLALCVGSMAVEISCCASAPSACEASTGRLSPVREFRLPAGCALGHVGILPDTMEGGWGGPSDVWVGNQGELVVADTGNRRLLVLDRTGQTTAAIKMPCATEPYFAGMGREGWLVAVGVRDDGSGCLARLPTHQHESDPAACVQLPDGWYVTDVASDREGVTYLAAHVGDVSLWRMAWDDRVPQAVAVDGDSQATCWSIARGADGHVYALVGSSTGVGLVRFTSGGEVGQRWELGPTTAADELLGVDRSDRAYFGSRITAESPTAHPSCWGYLVRCYGLEGDRAALISQAEIRYWKGDMEGYPGCVALGDGIPVALSPEGSPVLRVANSRLFKLKFYAAPPWREPCGTPGSPPRSSATRVEGHGASNEPRWVCEGAEATPVPSTRTPLDVESPYRIRSRTVPAEFARAYEFLEFIKQPEEWPTGFEAGNAPHWNTSKFLSYLSPRGVTFTDVNEGGLTDHRSTERIRGELIGRSGAVFERFAHLSHIYSIPFTQYSELTFRKVDSWFIVNVGGWYDLTFVPVKGRLCLSKCDYRVVEGC